MTQAEQIKDYIRKAETEDAIKLLFLCTENLPKLNNAAILISSNFELYKSRKQSGIALENELTHIHSNILELLLDEKFSHELQIPDSSHISSKENLYERLAFDQNIELREDLDKLKNEFEELNKALKYSVLKNQELELEITVLKTVLRDSVLENQKLDHEKEEVHKELKNFRSRIAEGGWVSVVEELYRKHESDDQILLLKTRLKEYNDSMIQGDTKAVERIRNEITVALLSKLPQLFTS